MILHIYKRIININNVLWSGFIITQEIDYLVISKKVTVFRSLGTNDDCHYHQDITCPLTTIKVWFNELLKIQKGTMVVTARVEFGGFMKCRGGVIHHYTKTAEQAITSAQYRHVTRTKSELQMVVTMPVFSDGAYQAGALTRGT